MNINNKHKMKMFNKLKMKIQIKQKIVRINKIYKKQTKKIMTSKKEMLKLKKKQLKERWILLLKEKIRIDDKKLKSNNELKQLLKGPLKHLNRYIIKEIQAHIYI